MVKLNEKHGVPRRRRLMMSATLGVLLALAGGAAAAFGYSMNTTQKIWTTDNRSICGTSYWDGYPPNEYPVGATYQNAGSSCNPFNNANGYVAVRVQMFGINQSTGNITTCSSLVAHDGNAAIGATTSSFGSWCKVYWFVTAHAGNTPTVHNWSSDYVYDL